MLLGSYLFELRLSISLHTEEDNPEINEYISLFVRNE
jgi:hypothetical protein